MIAPWFYLFNWISSHFAIDRICSDICSIQLGCVIIVEILPLLAKLQQSTNRFEKLMEIHDILHLTVWSCSSGGDVELVPIGNGIIHRGWICVIAARSCAGRGDSPPRKIMWLTLSSEMAFNSNITNIRTMNTQRKNVPRKRRFSLMRLSSCLMSITLL